MALKVARFLNLMLASVLVGNEFGGWAGVHPALKTLPLSTQVAAEQAVTQRYGRLMPGVMLSAILSCIPVLSLQRDRQSVEFRCTLAGMLCFVAMLGVTFVGNMPINQRTLQASPDAPPEDWPELRARWDGWHTLRNGLSFAGLGLLYLGALSHSDSERAR